jgi:hypothetical protein
VPDVHVATAGEEPLSPKTNLPLLSAALVPNHQLCGLVEWIRETEAAKRRAAGGKGTDS